MKSTILVINSTGPMASTVVAAVAEKFNFINLPLRKIFFHDYLVGKFDLDDHTIWNKVDKFIEALNEPKALGGVSVVDRDNSIPGLIIDFKNAKKDISILKKKIYNNVGEMYREIRLTLYSNIKYKPLNENANKHIELTTDIQKYNPDVLINAYEKNFDEVLFINLYRDFLGWAESLASQRFRHPRMRTRYKFLLSSIFKQYSDYKLVVSNYPGLHIDFSSLFDNRFDLIEKLSLFLHHDAEVDWENEVYDLHGKLCSYDETFNLSDYPGRYFSKKTIKTIKFLYEKGWINRYTDIFVNLLYLIDRKSFLRKLKK